MPPVEQEQTEEPEVNDIRSSLVSALAESEAPQEIVDAPGPEEPVETVDIKTGDEKPRDADGKFAKAEKTEKAAVVEKVETKTPEKVEAKTEKTDAKAIEPPADWTIADKEMFKSATPQMKEFLVRRYGEMTADYTRKTQALASFKTLYDPVDAVFQPHKDVMAQKGLTPAKLVQGWANVELALVQGNGVKVIKGLVDNYRIDRAQIAKALGFAPNGQGSESAAPPPNGTTAELPPIVAAKLGQLDEFLQNQERITADNVRRARESEEQRVQTDIEKFASATDDKGTPLHPYFKDVEGLMASLAIAARTRSEPIPSLDELYQTAVYANPSTKALVQANERAAFEAQREADAKALQEAARAKATKAQRAGKSVTGSPGTGQTPTARASGRSIRDELMSAAEESEAA